jgi:endonuclease YncB( thermonuclease family)
MLADTPMFSLDGYRATAVVVKVYDGDSIHAVFDYMGKPFKWNCRIAHVDAPEMRAKDADVKAKAVEARDQLKALILNKTVQLDCGAFDKYGRLLVEITVPESQLRVDRWLVENGHAKPYEGGTKTIDEKVSV